MRCYAVVVLNKGETAGHLIGHVMVRCFDFRVIKKSVVKRFCF